MNVVARKSLKGIVSSLAAAAIAFFSIAASPAVAQTASPVAQTSVAQVATSVHAADDAKAPVGMGDDEFSELFTSWKAIDESNGLAAAAPRAKVSVPSRMPLDSMTMTSDFGMRDHPILHKRRAHKGIDLAAPAGTPVFATADGVVSMAAPYSTYGNYVQIEHGAEMQTRYAHLSAFAVAAGDRVKKGDVIGYVGSTGRSTGPHLHYEVRLNDEALNPIPFMNEGEDGVQLAVAEGEGAAGGD